MDSLVAGAAAGLFVDLSLYPIDTVKTRIQSKNGFVASGGFKGVYKGLSAVAIGSVPGGALFFLTYDETKRSLFKHYGVKTDGNTATDVSRGALYCQTFAAMCGESAACLIRVPVEMVKQNMQVGHHPSVLAALRSITNNGAPGAAESIRIGSIYKLFSGMPIMLMRELPFSVIQMSLYELLKFKVNTSTFAQPFYYAVLPLCGAFSGGCAAFLTTPLDVLKTRIMLSRREESCNRGLVALIREIAEETPRPGDRFGTWQKFFRGASTRVLWISLGGGIFFGTYEFVKKGFTIVPT